MKPKYFAFLWIGILLLAVLAGVRTGASYQEHEEIGDDFWVSQVPIDWEDSEWKSAQSISEKSEFILSVEKTGSSDFLYYSTLTPVKVLSVFKGDGEDLTGKKIYLFEPACPRFDSKSYLPVNNYNLMLDDGEYLVCLNRRTFSDGYIPNHVEKNSFLFTTNCALSRYLRNSRQSGAKSDILHDVDDLKYKDVKLQDVIISDKKQMDFYNRFKKEMLAAYK